MHDFIERLRQIREEKNLSLEDCAEKLGLTAQFLAMIEIGEVIPTNEQQEAIIEYILDQI